MSLFFWRKCFLCKGRKDLNWVEFYGYGDSYKYFYHTKCIEECLCHPEDKTSKQLNMAADIVNKIKKIKGKRKQLEERVRNICKEIIGEGKT